MTLILDQTAPLQGRQLDRLELIAVSYLTLPVLVFLLGWLYWPFALGLGALALIAWVLVARQCQLQPAELSALTPATWLAIAGVSALWVSLSGLAGDFRLNSDWAVRMSVLRDLTVGAWPISYGQQEGHDIILRLPMGYYLVPALLGKIMGASEEAARLALWLWTTLGAALFLGLILGSLHGRRPVWQIVVMLLGVVAFSGMDIVGSLIRRPEWPASGQHLEWWAQLFQYSSNTTLMFWVPNHALPGWLAALLVWRHREQGLSLAATGLLMLGVVVWAPLVAVGLAPLLLMCSLRTQSPIAWAREWLQPSVLCLIFPGLLTISFITFGVPSEAASALSNAGQLGPIAIRLITFSFLEWGIFAWPVLRSNPRNWLVWISAVELLLLPLLRFGPGNDIVMRGGIAPLTIIMVAALMLLLDATVRQRAAQILVAVCLLVGAVTPYEEIYRAFYPGPRYESQGQNFVQLNGLPWHYVGLLNHSWLPVVLAKPVLLSEAPKP
jgi:hypothetical protein